MRAVLDLLHRHVSVRDFAPGDVDDPDWAAILRAGQQASTDATGQLYCAIEVHDAEHKRRLAALAGDQAHVAAAPRLIVVCLDTRRLRLLLEHRGETFGMKPSVALLFGITDASLFAQNLTVAAEALGYGACYLGAVQNHVLDVIALLKLPPGVMPLWGLTFGRPAKTSGPKPRIPTDLVVHRDHYRDLTPADAGRAYDVMKAATRSGDWVNPIRKYFGQGGIMAQREAEFRAALKRQGFDLADTE